MSIFTEKKYLQLISPQLDRFKQRSGNLWNFRCPFCGDSQKNEYKSRGYIFERENSLFFMCHNCHASMRFNKFLKLTDINLYNQFYRETYFEKKNIFTPDAAFAPEKLSVHINNIIQLKSIASLDDKHPAKVLLHKRMIPSERFDSLYYAPNFRAFVHEHYSGVDMSEKRIPDDERIIIPFFGLKGELLGLQGRAIDPKNEIRYMTIKPDESALKVYNLNNINFNKRIYVTEGIFDSMFLPNSLATLDSNLSRIRPMLGLYDYVLVPDRDVRNREVLSAVNKMIELQYMVCLLPRNFPGKDINEGIMNGVSQSELLEIVEKNSFQGLRLKLEFSKWKQI
jgi:transcription elongation factor Elf1